MAKTDSDVVRIDDLSDLETGKVFDKDELILVRTSDRMMTICQGGPSEVMCIYYDVDVRTKSVRDRETVYNLLGEGPNYEIFRQKLGEVGLWR